MDFFNGLDFFSIFFILLDSFIVVTALRMLWRIALNKSLSLMSHSYSVHPKGAQKRILIVGDSTSYGTGATRPEESLSGLLAHDLPRVEIENLSENGFRTRDLIAILEKKKEKRYDLVIISIGGNDVWHLSAYARLEKDIVRVLDLANILSGRKTILLVYSNIGFAPFFPKMLRRFLGTRALCVQNIFTRVAKERDIACVDLFSQFYFFEKEPKKYFAPDMLHPSSAGYRLWYREIWAQLAVDNTCPWAIPPKKSE